MLLAGCVDHNWETNDITDVMPDLEFDLVDENGQDVSAEDYIGKPTFVFFGFTHCPDVCPTTLAKLSAAIKQLDESRRDDVQVLFVSVDPGRDTPQIMKQYTQAFGPQFIGLTGQRKKIDAVTNRYRVTYEYGERDDQGHYNVTHSSSVFAFNREGEARFMASDFDTIDSILGDLKYLLKHG
ncbi:SCO family protein [Halomonas almeriensis]|uniref:SCO family protein n=1 Tax=Halomonas almeriensis TaxID=308163 RepID=UPI0025B5C694|nr:SCO family protein [Halomonas almeriensis]MDN3554028.1 SCO family protein [Halomonas almeriensis]